MRIGVYACSASPESGGAYTYQDSLLRAISRASLPHDIIVFHYGLKGYDFSKMGLNSFQLKSPHQSKGPLVKRVKRKVERLTRTIQEVNSWRESELNRACLEHKIDVLWFISDEFQLVEVPYIYTLWDLQHRKQPYFPEVTVTGLTFEQREKIFATACRRASYVITPNQAGKKEVMDYYGVEEARIRTIAQPVSEFALTARDPKESSLNSVGASEGEFYFYPAQFWPHKNHILILLALKRLAADHGYKPRVVFTGSDKGNKKYIESQVKKLGLTEQVQFLGFVTQETMTALYQKATALVYPSFFGPENMPPVEAFALGCPVIAAQVDGSEEQLEGASILFDPMDEKALADAITTLRKDKALRARLVEAGKVKAQSRTADHFVKKVKEIFDEFAKIRRAWSSESPYVHL